MVNRVKSEKGFTFIEVVIALAIVGVIAVGFASGLGTAAKGLLTTDERETANNLAESQMEYVKNLPYAMDYDPSPDILSEYDNYDADIDVAALADGNIQKVTVSVHHQDKLEVITLEDYKVNR
jgi:prepilin-type N-terminal cleavage/methylation domain-containing protein